MNSRSKYLTGHALLATMMWGKSSSPMDKKYDGVVPPPVRSKYTSERPPCTLKDGLFYEQD
jgi:hypothetical protein